MENLDLEKEVKRYSEVNGYSISAYESVKCKCGNHQFHLYSDDTEGGAYIICSACNSEKDIENSKKYIEEHTNNICNCNNSNLVIGVGKAFYEDSEDPRWVYVGAKCNKCSLVGVYVDWKCP